MRRRWYWLLVLMLSIGGLSSLPARADGYGHGYGYHDDDWHGGHGGHWRHDGGRRVGVYLNFGGGTHHGYPSYGYPGPRYGYAPTYYAPPYYAPAYPAQVVVVQPAARVVPAEGSTFFCNNPIGYFPNVQQCFGPWYQVLPGEEVVLRR
jgi:hypothetical protein